MRIRDLPASSIAFVGIRPKGCDLDGLIFTDADGARTVMAHAPDRAAGFEGFPGGRVSRVEVDPLDQANDRIVVSLLAAGVTLEHLTLIESEPLGFWRKRMSELLGVVLEAQRELAAHGVQSTFTTATEETATSC